MTREEREAYRELRAEAILEQLRNASPQQVMNWFDANVQTQADAIQHLRRLTRAVHYLIMRCDGPDYPVTNEVPETPAEP